MSEVERPEPVLAEWTVIDGPNNRLRKIITKVKGQVMVVRKREVLNPDRKWEYTNPREPWEVESKEVDYNPEGADNDRV